MGFSGERLKTARIFRNLTITQLSDMLVVSKQAISQYEKNQSIPKAEVLFRIVKSLDFPMAYFNNDDTDIVVDNTFFRALLSTRKLDLETQEVKAKYIALVYDFLESIFDFPKLNLFQGDGIDIADPEVKASELRNYWGLEEQPISNVISLLEKNGVIVSNIRTSNDKIDAFSQLVRINGKKNFCVVLGSEKTSLVRRNFSAAHELGHIIMHSELSDIREFDKSEYRNIELEANQFAAAFLLPREAFSLDLVTPKDLDSYKYLKQKWKVSISAMVMRAKQLGLISSNDYQNMMRKIAYRKWRVTEPYDEEWMPYEPKLFNKAINMLIDKNIMTGSQIVNKMSSYGISLNAKDIEDLLNLKQGILLATSEEEEGAIVLQLK